MKRLQEVSFITLIVSLVGSWYLIHNQERFSLEREKLKKTLDAHSNERLLKMFRSGQKILRWQHDLEEVNSHVMKEFLKGEEKFRNIDHYPEADVFDRETFSQYYYHGHRKGEHGHFHLFLRRNGIPEGITPCFSHNPLDQIDDTNCFSHLIAISMDNEGHPIKLFTTNRWVTGETWYQSDDVCRMIEHFHIKSTSSLQITHQWLDAMLQLFYPQIIELIRKREEVVMKNRKDKPLIEAIEARDLDVLSEIEISVEIQMDVLEEVIQERGLHSG